MTAATPHRLCQAIMDGAVTPAELDDYLRLHLTDTGATLPTVPTDWLPPAVPFPPSAAQSRQFLACLAPTLWLAGVWLARVARPDTAQRDSECHLFELYSRSLSLAEPLAAPARHLRAGLIELGLPDSLEEGLGSALIPAADFVWGMPALQLALLHRPRHFLPELLGFTRAHYELEGHWWQAVMPSALTGWVQLRQAGQTVERALIHRAIATCTAQTQADFQPRLAQGYALYRAAFSGLVEGAIGWMQSVSSPRQVVRDLVAARQAHAIGYHGRVRLGGRSLDEWMRTSTDPDDWLDKLKDSPWSDTACPQGSRLLRAMQFGGPMFGVFSTTEQQQWQRWMQSDETTIDWPTPPTSQSSLPPPGAVLRQRSDAITSGTPTARRLYHALLQVDTPLAVPRAADRVVQRTLRRGQWLARLSRQPRLPRPYAAGSLRHFIDATHRQELDRHRPLVAAPGISRDFCRFALLQLAPAILVDGAWLIGVAGHDGRLDGVRQSLLQIYADEIGNGQAEWNHPNVYRRLLDSLALSLPPIDSEAFVADRRFIPAAFDLPVYLLSMGWLAGRYFPELLGLNLAIELSGLGATYLRAIDVLAHYGMDTTLFRLHLSIDNPASGHTALARNALESFMAQQERQLGQPALTGLWQRVIRGHDSLNAASLSLVASLALHYLPERLGHRRRADRIC